MVGRLLWLLVLTASGQANGIDDKMKALSQDLGSSITSISSANNHRLDWMFIVDHGGFKRGDLKLEYSRNLIQQLSSHLYISPMHSQAGVITYGSTAQIQIPLNVSEGNQCEFNKKINRLNFTAGASNMNLALQTAIDELQSKGRSTSPKVMVLITTAGWENGGDNPYVIMEKAKGISTLIVVVLVFNRADSPLASVILSFASQRASAPSTSAHSAISQHKYAFEIEANRGRLRRLYRHFLLAVEEMPYLPLQVPASHCPACAAREACVCDVNLYNTYHCEQDSNEPLITVGCPSDIMVETEPGKPTARVTWLSAKAVDYSSSMKGTVIVKPFGLSSSQSNVATVNRSHLAYTFSIGRNLVTHQFADSGGNSINCSFSVTVEDKEAPKILNCPASTIFDNATSLMSEKRVYWPDVTATDNSRVAPTSKLYINQAPQTIGARSFSIGTSAVRIDFTDGSGNFATCQFSVTVQDYEPPVVQRCDGPNSTIYSSELQIYVNWNQPQFIDNSRQPVTITGDKNPGYFRIGAHTVTYTATDNVGNSRNCSFTFTVRGYPCPKLSAPHNGAVVCDNAVPGATCQIMCKNPFDFESISGLPKLPEKYSCIGTGIWYPNNQIPHCVERQGRFKKLPQTYYFDGDCADANVRNTIKANAVKHYDGFVEGGYFKEAWGRDIGIQDFIDPVCGADAAITVAPSTTIPTIPTGTPTTPPTRSFPTANTNANGVIG